VFESNIHSSFKVELKLQQRDNDTNPKSPKNKVTLEYIQFISLTESSEYEQCPITRLMYNIK